MAKPESDEPEAAAAAAAVPAPAPAAAADDDLADAAEVPAAAGAASGAAAAGTAVEAEPLFKTAAGGDSVTKKSAFANLNWFGDAAKPFTAIDTPGHDDPDGADIDSPEVRHKFLKYIGWKYTVSTSRFPFLLGARGLGGMAADLHNNLHALGDVHAIGGIHI